MELRRWKALFYSEAMAVSPREKILSGFLAFIALLCVAAVSYAATGPQAAIYLVASMGAAVVLVQAVPNSPLSQPWPLLGGHLVSALIGVVVYHLLPHTLVAGPLAVGLAVAGMYFLHCLHPPGGAAALVAVIGGEGVHQLGYWYVLMPVGLNAAIMLIMALVINNIVPSRSYPARAGKQPAAPDPLLRQLGLNEDDLIAALHERDLFLDISREDLREIYRHAIMHANKRRLGSVLCRDIMTTEVLTFNYHSDCAEAWAMLQSRRLKAAPVIDGHRKVLGIIAMEDFVRAGAVVTAAGTEPVMRKQLVGNIMSSPAVCVRADRHIVDLLPIFIDHSIHHLPVTDDQDRLQGMITRTDLMRAMLVTYI